MFIKPNSPNKNRITLFITLVLTFVFFNSNAQEIPTSNDSGPNSRFIIGAYFSPDIAYRELENTGDNSAIDVFISNQNSEEVFKVGYTFGLSVAYTLTENFEVETGIQINNKGYQSKIAEVRFGDIIDPRHGFIYSVNDFNIGQFTHVRLKYNYNYIGIPLHLNYILGNGKWNFIISVGATSEYLYHASTKAIYFNGDKKQSRSKQKSSIEYNKLNLSSSISLGVDYQLNKKMSLRATPTIRKGMLQIIDIPIASYLYNGGLQIGWYMKI